jgi:hypothetical protein
MSEPSSAVVEGSTLSTTASSTPTAGSATRSGNGYAGTGIPPAPSAAEGGAAGGKGRERVWWLSFLIPFLILV